MKKTALLFRLLLIVAMVAGLTAISHIYAAPAPLVLTMFSEDINPDDTGFTDPVAQEITKRTGVKLKIEYVVGDPQQKKTLMIASGDYPDLIFQKGANQYVDAKAFIDLTPYIDRYGKNVKALYGPYLKRLRYSQQDKSIYSLGCYGVGSEVWEPSGVQLQHAVAKELGYPKMKTVKDFEAAIKAYKDKHPTIDGQPTIGLSLIADDWRILISVTNQAVFATGGPDDGEYYIDPKTKKAVYHYTRPEEQEYFRWLNHMNDVGLLDPECFVQKYDQYQAKIASGRVLALTDAWWEYDGAQKALKEAGKFDRAYGSYPIVLNDKYKRADLQNPGYSGTWGIAITTKCKDKLKAFKLLNWWCSDEAQVLVNWGIKGKNYTIENGKRVMSPTEWARLNGDPNYKRETGIGQYVYPFPQRGDGLKDKTGSTYTTKTPQSIIDKYTPIEKEVLAGYNAKMWMDLFPKDKEFPLKTWPAGWQVQTPTDASYEVPRQKCQDIIWKRIPEMIMAKPEKFDGLWDSMMAELKAAGMDQMVVIFNQSLANVIKLWND